MLILEKKWELLEKSDKNYLQAFVLGCVSVQVFRLKLT
jgi:hypothetical protein